MFLNRLIHHINNKFLESLHCQTNHDNFSSRGWSRNGAYFPRKKKGTYTKTQPETCGTERDFEACGMITVQYDPCKGAGVFLGPRNLPSSISQWLYNRLVSQLMVEYFRRIPNQSWGFFSSKRSMASGSEVGVKGVGTTLIWYWITLLLPLIEKPKKLSDIKTEVQLPWKLEQKKPWKHLPAEVFTLCLWLSLP